MPDSQSSPGRPPGIPRDGLYGRGIKTEVCRVPAGSSDLAKRLLADLPELVQSWELAARDTRDWTKLNQLMGELKAQFPELFIDVSQKLKCKD